MYRAILYEILFFCKFKINNYDNFHEKKFSMAVTPQLVREKWKT